MPSRSQTIALEARPRSRSRDSSASTATASSTESEHRLALHAFPTKDTVPIRSCVSPGAAATKRRRQSRMSNRRFASHLNWSMETASAADPTNRYALRASASWIRDVLDPKIARDGPEVMCPDEVLTLHELFLKLQHADINLATLKYSRIHYAVLDVAGKATRWPAKLIDACDNLIDYWTAKFGPLANIRPYLYGPGGRLMGVASVADVTRSALLKRWREQSPDIMTPSRSKKHGALGFTPGQWWINGMFAFRDGIIDLESTDGGIVCDEHSAYAVVLKDNSEIAGSTPTSFTYRCKPRDPGRFRLTAADFKNRYPLRVLRSHSLSSLWGPRCGIRYEGLHKVSGWTIKGCNPVLNEGAEFLFEIKFDSIENGDTIMDEVLKHPLAEEVDDYQEYKRLRRLQRELMRTKAELFMSGQEQPSSTGHSPRREKTETFFDTPSRTSTFKERDRLTVPGAVRTFSRTSLRPAPTLGADFDASPPRTGSRGTRSTVGELPVTPRIDSAMSPEFDPKRPADTRTSQDRLRVRFAEEPGKSSTELTRRGALVGQSHGQSDDQSDEPHQELTNEDDLSSLDIRGARLTSSVPQVDGAAFSSVSSFSSRKDRRLSSLTEEKRLRERIKYFLGDSAIIAFDRICFEDHLFGPAAGETARSFLKALEAVSPDLELPEYVDWPLCDPLNRKNTLPYTITGKAARIDDVPGGLSEWDSAAHRLRGSVAVVDLQNSVKRRKTARLEAEFSVSPRTSMQMPADYRSLGEFMRDGNSKSEHTRSPVFLDPFTPEPRLADDFADAELDGGVPLENVELVEPSGFALEARQPPTEEAAEEPQNWLDWTDSDGGVALQDYESDGWFAFRWSPNKQHHHCVIEP